jgi:hypothetical protein
MEPGASDHALFGENVEEVHYCIFDRRSLLHCTAAIAQKPDDVVRVNTELVSFEVSVTDKAGNPVKNLQHK